MCEKLSYQIINISAVNEVVFCYYQQFAKIIKEKKTLVSAVARNEGMHFFKFTKRDLARVISINLDVAEFLNSHIFNWYKALYSASSSNFRHLDFTEQLDGFVQLHPWCIRKDRQLCLHKYVKYQVLYPIIAQAKQIKIQGVTMTTIRLFL